MRSIWPYISQILSDREVGRVVFRDISNPGTQYRKIFRNSYEIYRIPDELNLFPGTHYVSVNIGQYMAITWDMEEAPFIYEELLERFEPVFILNKWKSAHKHDEHPVHGDCYSSWRESNTDLCFLDKKNVHRCSRIRAFFEAPRNQTSFYRIKKKFIAWEDAPVLLG